MLGPSCLGAAGKGLGLSRAWLGEAQGLRGGGWRGSRPGTLLVDTPAEQTPGAGGVALLIPLSLDGGLWPRKRLPPAKVQALPLPHGRGASWRLDPLRSWGLEKSDGRRSGPTGRCGGLGQGCAHCVSGLATPDPGTPRYCGPPRRQWSGGGGTTLWSGSCWTRSSWRSWGAGARHPGPPGGEPLCSKTEDGGRPPAGLRQPPCLIPTPCPQVLPGPGPSPAAAAPARRGLAAPVSCARVAPGRPAVWPERGHHAAATG